MMLPKRARVTVRPTADGQYTAETDGGPPVALSAAQMVEGGVGIGFLAELGLPADYQALEALAEPRGLSDRRVEFIVADESPTRLGDGRRLRPQRWTYQRAGQALTFSHSPLVIGLLEAVYVEPPDGAPRWSAPPSGRPPRWRRHVEGAFLLGRARLYDSALADAARRGVQRGIFGTVSPILAHRDPADLDAAELVEVGLSEWPACPNARILRAWEEET